MRAIVIAASNLHLMQEDGALPRTLAFGRAPGESGLSVVRLGFRGSADFSATPRQHLVWFHLSPPVQFDCRIGERTLRHAPATGAMTVCPAGVDSAAHTDSSVDEMIVIIEPRSFLLAAAEEAEAGARLEEQFSRDDQRLLALARQLERESSEGYPNGALFWNDVASGFVGHLVGRHASQPVPAVRGRLGRQALQRVRDHVMAHLGEPIDVDTLAGLACLSPFHFSRVFARSVGVTPHRYVVHLRLRRALELARTGDASLAEIAARTGFADQSHLSRWIRRVYGVPVTRLMGTRLVG